ncbi:MAG: hypothetical protein ACOZNI_36835 [Myxococcota bacterium]
MELFTDRLVADLDRMPGARHSFLKQICAPDACDVRARLQAQIDQLGAPMDERAVELLSSLDNRRFFQGFAEVATLGALRATGWEAAALHRPGPRIEVRRAGSPPWMLSVLAFLHQTRPGGEEDTRQRLVDALARVQSRQRFAVLIRRWLPHDFDPDPVRRAIELWLGQVQGGQWDGRYAAYDDEHISLEFCLTGERARARQSPVAMVLGPFFAHRTLEVLEPRVVQELDRHRAAAQRNQPLVLACVSDQPWALNEGYVRDFLYGRARRMQTGEGVTEVEFAGAPSVCVFRDPLYDAIAGVLFVDRRPAAPTRVRARAMLNPWARQPLTPADLGVRAFAEDPARTAAARAAGTPDARVLVWQDGASEIDL